MCLEKGKEGLEQGRVRGLEGGLLKDVFGEGERGV